ADSSESCRRRQPDRASRTDGRSRPSSGRGGIDRIDAWHILHLKRYADNARQDRPGIPPCSRQRPARQRVGGARPVFQDLWRWGRCSGYNRGRDGRIRRREGAMELVATELNPVPSQPVITPVTTADGIVLRAVRWRATARRTRGTVCLVQGRAEFIEKYFETVADLRRRGFAVVAFDWRGQGGSQRDLANPRKGHVDDFSLYERDLAAIVDQVILPRCPPPYFVLAHSMGGTILLHALRGKKTPFARLVTVAPMIDIAMVPWPRAARVLSEMLDAAGLGAG